MSVNYKISWQSWIGPYSAKFLWSEILLKTPVSSSILCNHCLLIILSLKVPKYLWQTKGKLNECSHGLKYDKCHSILQTVENDYLNSSLWEVEPFLHYWGQFSDSPAFFTEDILCSGGQDNDFSTCWGDTDFYTTVAIFCQLSRQKIVQLSLEHSICNELQKAIWFNYRACKYIYSPNN